ncbi:MAG TPA: regulatory iron-sulfur-containing complex subunit RicT [Anaerolineae bacterium]|nr:regulatory iron-sulfur-containing complex subunit RicT [Anaerolineae bacterium]
MRIERNNKDNKETTVYEVEFKGSRKDYYGSPDNISIKVSEYVIVQADRGEHIGHVTRFGPWSMFPQAKELKSIIRHASYTDKQIMVDNKWKEEEAFKVCQSKIIEHELKMKLVDVEYQFDGNKICFYFTADKRIDFRNLVKDLAAEYRTRIELRQIGVRDEARRLGGIGVCGRPLCCKTFLNQFEPITSQMARDQNLSLSPSKISGLCGRLMCCLAFEEDFYRLQSDILPGTGVVLENEGKRYKVKKVDIFNESLVLIDEVGEEKIVNINDFIDYRIVESVIERKFSATCTKYEAEDEN